MKLISIILFMLIATTAAAEEPTCADLSKLAGTVMSARQAGVSIQSAAEITPQPFIRLLVAVYDFPVMNSAEAKLQLIKEVEEQTYLTCLETRNP